MTLNSCAYEHRNLRDAGINKHKKKLFIAKQNDSFSPGRHKPIF